MIRTWEPRCRTVSYPRRRPARVVVGAGARAGSPPRILEFFAGRIANARTRAAYGRAVGQFPRASWARLALLRFACPVSASRTSTCMKVRAGAPWTSHRTAVAPRCCPLWPQRTSPPGGSGNSGGDHTPLVGDLAWLNRVRGSRPAARRGRDGGERGDGGATALGRAFRDVEPTRSSALRPLRGMIRAVVPPKERTPASSQRPAEPASSDSTSEHRLFERARRGSRPAVDALFERCRPWLRRWARGRLPQWVRSDIDTSDLVQDALQHTFARLPFFESKHVGALRVYLQHAVENRIHDRLRRATRRSCRMQPFGPPRAPHRSIRSSSTMRPGGGTWTVSGI